MMAQELDLYRKLHKFLAGHDDSDPTSSLAHLVVDADTPLDLFTRLDLE